MRSLFNVLFIILNILLSLLFVPQTAKSIASFDKTIQPIIQSKQSINKTVDKKVDFNSLNKNYEIKAIGNNENNFSSFSFHHLFINNKNTQIFFYKNNLNIISNNPHKHFSFLKNEILVRAP